MDRGAWWVIVRGVTRGDMTKQLSPSAVLSTSLYLINTLHQETREKEGNFCKYSLVISLLFVTLDKLSGRLSSDHRFIFINSVVISNMYHARDFILLFKKNSLCYLFLHLHS